MKNKDKAIWKDGVQIQLAEEQWEQIEDAVESSVIPGFEIDRMWSDEQLADMREKGVLVEYGAEESRNGNQKRFKYTVISNEQCQYVILLTDTGVETYDLSESAQQKLQEILSD